MRKIDKFSKGMGIGGWLTNYKRFNVLPEEWRMKLTEGDMEHFETYITEADVRNIKEMGLDHIRLGFDQILLEDVTHPYKGRILDLLHRFVDWCEAYDLGVVLNMHKAVGSYCDVTSPVSLLESEELQERFLAVWSELEEEFSDRVEVMFELLNEVKDEKPEAWNALAERTIKAIRQKNATRRIIVGTTCWNPPHTLNSLKVYDDENIFYTFHQYAPHEFTHQRGVLMASELYYNRKMEWPSEDIERYRDFHRLLGKQDVYPDLERMDIEFIRRELAGPKAFIEKYPDKVLWCGEFGTIRHADITSRENWMRDNIQALKELDIPYCVWNYLSTPNDGNRFSLVDDESRKILSQRLLRIINGEAD